MHLPRERGGRVLAAAAAVATLSAAVLVQLNLWHSPDAQATTDAPLATTATAATTARTVTLITGDRVTVRGTGATTVEPGTGRTGMQFLTRRIGDHLSVIPSDALWLMQSGRLDNRLFDVTELLNSGADQRPDLRIIVTHTDSAREITLSDVTTGGGQLMRDLPAVRGLAVRAEKANAGRLWDALTDSSQEQRTLDDGVDRIWLDGQRQLTLDESVPQIGAPTAWAAGFDGTGVTVAVLDSGIDATHADLAGRVTAESNFTEGAEGNQDLVGHGTHVAATVASSGAASDGRYKGVAPGARLLDGKVCAANGCAESWILAGMQWAAERGAKVVNLSLGGPDTAGVDPLEEAVQSLTDKFGTLFVIAAGNTAPALPVNSPASADAALAVGAVSKSDQLANFSSRGPRLGDSAIKPDLTAPGVDITAARSKDSSLGAPGDLYTTLSGTSMATPHAAGAAAILAQQHPDWSGSQLKAGLMESARPSADRTVFEQGSGRLDMAQAITRSVIAAPGSLSFGRQVWPHDDDSPVAKTVTYRNDGTAAVTLALAVTATGPDGDPAGAGTFSLDAPSVTVPAGGTAAVQVTVDTRIDGPDGLLVGELAATAGSTTVRTPVAVDREVESFQLNVAHLGLDGQPAGDHTTVVANWDGSVVQTVQDPDGTATARLPRGTYSVLSVVTSQKPDQSGFVFAALAQPRVDLTGNQTVTMDARLGRPVSVTAPAADATSVFAEVGMIAKLPGSSVEVGTLGGNFSSITTAQVGPDTAADLFAARFAATYARTGADGSILDSPYAYQFTWYNQGRMPAGFTREVAAADLATVRADHAGQTEDTEGRKAAWSALPDVLGGGFAAALPFGLPSIRTEFYNTDGGGSWGRSLDEVVPGDQPQFVTSTVAPLTTYQAGQSYQESWNRGVFGPTVATPQSPDLWVTRTGDEMRILSPLYGDGAGRAGYSALATGTTAVFRNGEKVAESAEPRGEFSVPAANGDYRVEIVSERPEPAELSTRVEVVWTFNSGHVAGDAPQRLPVSTVQFTPPVDNENTAPAGQTAVIPVVLQSQPDSTSGALRTLTVEVSFDDGQNWTQALLLTGPTRAQVAHPATAGFVSLRATATDTAGNTVTQTVLRAYRIA